MVLSAIVHGDRYSTCNLDFIGQAVLEQNTFENDGHKCGYRPMAGAGNHLEFRLLI